MITLFSDPHLGLNRQAGTSPASRKTIRQNILITASGIPGDNKVCLGDLFDRYSNDEEVILDAYGVYEGLSFCLAGNHDLKNTADSVGSMQFLGSLLPHKLIINKFGTSGAHKGRLDGVQVVSVPHCSSQDLFYDSLCEAEELGGELLLLHANWDMPAHHELSDTELNLTREVAEELLKTFKYIVLGHTHNRSEHLNGRVINIGSIYPTSFGDMKSKRYLTYENGEFTSHETWSASRYAELTWPEIPEDLDADFVRIKGKRKQAESKEFLTVMGSIRKSSLAIKDDTELEGMGSEFTGSTHPMKLSESIEKSLESRPAEHKLWRELS